MDDNDNEQLSALVGDIYDAALDPSLWPNALCKAAGFVGGPAAALFFKNATSKTGNVAYEYGTDPHYRKLYFEHYVKLDPATIGHCFGQIEEPIAIGDLIAYDEFLQTRFYREWARPQGLVDFVAAVLDKNESSAALFGVFRHERDGLVDEGTRRRMRLIVPHVRRAVLVAKLIDLKQAKAATLADTLDGLAAGLILVDANSHIVHANASGGGILAADDFLRSIGGRLVARDGQIDRSMREIFADSGDAEIGIKGIALPLTAHDGERHVAHVLPLTSGARRSAGNTYRASASVFIRKAEMETRSPPEVIAKTYALTPTELRVLLAIVDVGGVPEVATALGVAETTIKTHLGRLFEKTGATRQADLVKLVAGFSSPLAG
jgi:DNA-binding CsgD family transcriptional regulator